MEVSIEWSELAETQLKDIYDYYFFNVSPKIAMKIVTRIVKRVEILYTNPLLGSKEELLKEYHEDFRYLVESNYKIIYWCTDGAITIASIFDSRQNPEKIQILR